MGMPDDTAAIVLAIAIRRRRHRGLHMTWPDAQIIRPMPWTCARGWCRRRSAASPGFSPDGLRMLLAIGEPPEDEREAFDLVRV
jgi:hypothetical protein